MMSEVKRMSVDISNGNHPKVDFEGTYVTKRELDLIVKAVKRAHKQIIINYRKQLIIAEYQKKQSLLKGKSDGKESQSRKESDAGTSREPSSTDGRTKGNVSDVSKSNPVATDRVATTTADDKGKLVSKA